jgi:hypothetical protein
MDNACPFYLRGHMNVSAIIAVISFVHEIN